MTSQVASTMTGRGLVPWIFGAVLILVMLVAPGGIVGVYRRTLARIRRNRAQRASVATAAETAST